MILCYLFSSFFLKPKQTEEMTFPWDIVKALSWGSFSLQLFFQFSSAHKGSCGDFCLMSYSDSSSEPKSNAENQETFSLWAANHSLLTSGCFFDFSDKYFISALLCILYTWPRHILLFPPLSLEGRCRASFKWLCRMTEAPLSFERQICLLSLALKISY